VVEKRGEEETKSMPHAPVPSPKQLVPTKEKAKNVVRLGARKNDDDQTDKKDRPIKVTMVDTESKQLVMRSLKLSVTYDMSISQRGK
jgi:hypothetical protein